MTIQAKCNTLNKAIHNRLFLNNYLTTNVGDYERVFTSIDLIEDSQDAIEEFGNIPETNFQKRSTLYIYGVLQSLYCQQDGLFNLYKTITKASTKNVYEMFKLYSFTAEIRNVRDDIAGHPTDRKKGKEFYFIAKGSNSKYNFSYAGYTPHFRKVDVDLKQFIKEQNKFTHTILDQVEKSIAEQINIHKDKFKKMKLLNIVENLNYPIQLIYRGIFSNHLLASSGLKEIKGKLDELKAELINRYNNSIPDSLKDIFRLQDYILKKVEHWISNNELQNNLDAEIFLDSFDNQLNELFDILKEIDEDFVH